MSLKETVVAHFISFYKNLAKNSNFSKKNFTQEDTLYRCVSHGSLHYNNAVIDRDVHDGLKSDLSIEKQKDYYAALDIPFVWYVDETANPEFFEKLKTCGFQDVGVFQGVIGPLDELQETIIPDNCTLVQITTSDQMQHYNTLTTAVFGPDSIEIPHDTPNTYHFLALVDSKPVSALSIYIEGSLVSFWNGVTLPEHRKKGLSTALRQHALNLAVSNGCTLGISYLMSTSGASGICKKTLGYKTEWLYRTFVLSSASN